MAVVNDHRSFDARSPEREVRVHRIDEHALPPGVAAHQRDERRQRQILVGVEAARKPHGGQVVSGLGLLDGAHVALLTRDLPQVVVVVARDVDDPVADDRLVAVDELEESLEDRECRGHLCQGEFDGVARQDQRRPIVADQLPQTVGHRHSGGARRDAVVCGEDTLIGTEVQIRKDDPPHCHPDGLYQGAEARIRSCFAPARGMMHE